jgi:phosphate transport system substrate-binding protein
MGPEIQGSFPALLRRVRIASMRRIPANSRKLIGKKRRSPFIFAALMCSAIAATALTAHSGETLVIGGTGSSIGAMRLMAESFQKRRPDITVTVLPSIGTAGGIRALSDNKVDIGLANRRLKPEERGVGIVEELYGRSAVVFGVHQSNPTTRITLAEIEEIYSGKRGTWSDGTPARLTLRPISDSLSAYLKGISPGLKAASDKARSIPGVFVAMTDQEAADHIERTRGSFGVVSAVLVSGEKRKIKALSIDNVAPTVANVLSGAYPYVITLSLVYKRDRYKGAIKDFVELVFSTEGRKLLRATDHVVLPRAAGE